VLQPGRDDNYPTSSGNAPAAFLSQSFTFQGVHISFMMIGVAIALLIVYNIARKRR